MSKLPCAQPPRWPLKRCLGPLLALLLAPLAAQGAQPNTTTVTANAQKLDFGSFSVLPSCANCTIIMDTNGVRTGSVGVVLTATNAGRAGTFSVVCNNGACPYSATVTGAPSMVAGSVTMTVGSFTVAKAGASTPSTVSVGGKLTIPRSGPLAGTYNSGTFTVTTTSP